jgi:copper(I)-binding protein
MSLQRLGLLAAGFLAVGAVEAAAPSRIVVAGGWTRPAMVGMNAAGYMNIVNGGALPDNLTGAASPNAARVSLHQSRMVATVSVMRPVAALLVPARGQAVLAPGGFHMMLEGLKQPLRPGGRVPVTLFFQRAGRVRIWLNVRTGPSAMSGMKM